MQVLKILFAAGFTFLSCLALGKLVLKWFRVELYRSEELFLGFVVGTPVLSTLVFLLSLTRLAYAAVFLIAGCGALGLAYYYRAWTFSTRRLERLPSAWSMLFGAVYGLWGCLYLLAALAPEASVDGATYHVALPALYLRAHRFVPLTSNLLADLSQGLEMLFLFAFAFGKHSAASMVHLLFTLITPVGLLSFGKRIGSPQAGAVGALLFLLSPAVALVGTVAYVDLAVVAVTFAVFYLMQIWWVEQKDALLILVALLAGFCYCIKYTAGIAVPYALGAILIRRIRSGKPVWRPCATVTLTALAVMSPWIVKNAAVVHNPVAPFANHFFPNPFLYPSTEHEYIQSVSSPDGLTALNWPYQITTRGGLTQGHLGPVFLLAPIALLALWTPAGRQLLCAAAVFLLPCLAAVPSRYFLPGLCFISLSFGLAVSRYAYLALGVILLHALLSWPAVIPKYASRNSPYLGWPDVRAALRLTSESDYLSRHVDGFGLGQLLDTKLCLGSVRLPFACSSRLIALVK
ncbi:MAG: glycosyltransferase family 39 protein [Acidobacteriota bacterium]|nr:glycosyltransferase family 39 protein [Acidobacteriota bacterium]